MVVTIAVVAVSIVLGAMVSTLYSIFKIPKSQEESIQKSSGLTQSTMHLYYPMVY